MLVDVDSETNMAVGISWSDFRSRIAIVTTVGFYLLSFEFNLNDGKFKIPNFFFLSDIQVIQGANCPIRSFSLLPGSCLIGIPIGDPVGSGCLSLSLAVLSPSTQR